jgi:hypothetical protein
MPSHKWNNGGSWAALFATNALIRNLIFGHARTEMNLPRYKATSDKWD